MLRINAERERAFGATSDGGATGEVEVVGATGAIAGTPCTIQLREKKKQKKKQKSYVSGVKSLNFKCSI
jgi:hypothetical protein